MIDVQEQNFKGQKYKNINLAKTIEAVLTLDNKNTEFKGRFGLKIRSTGEKKSFYGEQVLFQFWILEKLKEYKASTDRNYFEFYIDKMEAEVLLGKLLLELKNEQTT